MITTTALVLLTMTATVQPVSPTVTPTYTAGEFKAFERGWKQSVRNYTCIMMCDELKDMLQSEKDIKKKLQELKVDPYNAGPYNAGIADASYYRRQAKDLKLMIKSRKDCDCSK